MLEIVGFLFLVVVGALAILQGTGGALALYAVSGRFFGAHIFLLGVAAVGAWMLWYAFVHAPFHIVVGS